MGFQSQPLCSWPVLSLNSRERRPLPPLKMRHHPWVTPEHTWAFCTCFLPSIPSPSSGLGFVLGQTDSSRPKDSTPSPKPFYFSCKSLPVLSRTCTCVCVFGVCYLLSLQLCGLVGLGSPLRRCCFCTAPKRSAPRTATRGMKLRVCGSLLQGRAGCLAPGSRRVRAPGVLILLIPVQCPFGGGSGWELCSALREPVP